MRASGAEGHARNVLDAFPFDKHGEVLLDDEARRFAARGNADADHAVVLLDLDLGAAFNAASTHLAKQQNTPPMRGANSL